MTALTAISGDPDALVRSASRYQSMAATILDAAIDLDSARNDDVHISLAMEAIGADLQVASDALSQVYIRYRGTADALAEYAPHLRRAQDRAAQALAAADDAGQNSRELERRSRLYEDYANEKGPDEADWIARQNAAEEQLISSREAAGYADSEYHAALADLEIAAQAAIDRIRLAEESSGLTDPIFADEIAVAKAALKAAYEWSQKHLAPILEAIVEIAKVLSAVLSVLSVICAFLSFIPFFAAAFGVLQVISLAIELISLAALVLLFGLGKRTIGQMLSAALVAAIGILTKSRVSSSVGAVGKSAIGKIPVGEAGRMIGKHSVYEISVSTVRGAQEVSGHVVGHVVEGAIHPIEASEGLLDRPLVLFEAATSSSWSPPATVEVPDYSPMSGGTNHLEAVLESASVGSTSGRQPSICVVPAGALT